MRQLKEIKGTKIEKKRKKEIKLPLLADGIFFHVENTKGPRAKLLELLGEFTKVTKFKVSIQILIAFQCICLK